MWKDWNRWWNARGGAGEGPPEETECPAPKSENDQGAWDERTTVEAETSPDAKEDVVDGKSENAAESLGETGQPVEGVDEPGVPGTPYQMSRAAVILIFGRAHVRGEKIGMVSPEPFANNCTFG